MDAKMGDAATHMNNYEPSSDLIQEEACDTLLLYLPGFTREQLRAQLSGSRMLRISGTRPIGDNKLSSFQKDYPLSANCDINNITAKFEGGILYLRQPKLIIPAEKGDSKLPPAETPQPQKPVEEPPAAPSATKEKQEQVTTKKTTPSEDQIKKPSAKPVAAPFATKEKQEQVTTKKTTPSEDKIKQPSAKPVVESPVAPFATKEKQEQVTTKKTTPSEDQIKQPSAKDFSDHQSVQKAVTKPVEEKGDELVGAKRTDKNSAQVKTSSIDDDHKAVKSTIDRGEKFSGNIDSKLTNKRTKTTVKRGVGFYKLGAGSMVAKLNMSKQMMSIALAVILAFAFGMYVNNLIWNSSKPKN